MLQKIKMFFSIDLEKLRATRQGLPLFVDILMVNLVIINLCLIFFDWSYGFSSFRSILEWTFPAFNQFYAERIHPNASYLDLIFVSIFVTELLIRWAIAIYRKRYDKWFFYPFIHWYDVLGCIPMNGTLKLFRLFRIFGMIVRLNNLGIIDLKSTFFYKKFTEYTKIVIEEVSDKVVSNVLEGVQQEVQKDSPIVHQVVSKVILPKKDQINFWLNEQISETVSIIYYKHRNELYNYLKDIVSKSVYENPEIKRIALIPGVGKQIAEALDSSISNITFNVIDNSIEDMSKNKKVPVIEDITEHIIQQIEISENSTSDLNVLMKQIIHDTLEMVKNQVEIKMWKIKDLQIKREKLQNKLSEGRGNLKSIQAKIEMIDHEILELENPKK